MFRHGQNHIIHTDAQLLYGSGNDSLVCLMGHKPVYIRFRQTGIVEGFIYDLIHFLHGKLEDFITAHSDERLSFRSGNS